MLVHKFMMKAGANIVGSALSFVSLMVMTRYVGEQYGVMMWAWAFTAMFNAFSDLGFNAASMRYISRDGADQSACFSTFLAVKLVMSFVVMAMSAISVAISAMSGTMDTESVAVCVVFIVYYLMYNIQTALTVTFDGRLESGKSSMALAIEYGVRSVMLIILALLQVDASTLSTAYFIGILFSFAASLYMMRNTGLHVVRPRFIREYARFAAPLAFSIMAIALIEYLDKVMIGIYQGSLEVGFYTAAFGVVTAFTTLGTSLNNVLLPHLSKNRESHHESVEKTLWMSEKYISILIMPLLVFLMVLGRPIAIVLFGDGYADSGDILSIQSVHIYVFILTGLMAQVLYSVDRAKVYMKASIVFAAVSLIGFFTLIPDRFLGIPMADLGSIGAATSLALAYTVFAMVLVVCVRRDVGYRLCPGLWKVFASGAAGGLFLVAMQVLWGPEGLFQLAIVGIISEGVFLAAMLALKGIDRSDIDFIKSAFSRKGIQESISEEWR